MKYLILILLQFFVTSTYASNIYWGNTMLLSDENKSELEVLLEETCPKVFKSEFEVELGWNPKISELESSMLLYKLKFEVYSNGSLSKTVKVEYQYNADRQSILANTLVIKNCSCLK